MAIVARFRVATKATGTRRQIFIHVYDNREQLAKAHTKARGYPYNPDNDIAGGVVSQQGFRWPQPDPTPIIVMRLWTGQLTTRTIAHEAVHAAAYLYFMDSVSGWDSRARAAFMGKHEPLAYLVGDICGDVVANIYAHNLLK